MDFNFGDMVLSVYDNRMGVVCDIMETNRLQDYYIVEWADGTRTSVAREEIY